ncbi:protein mono-ADP-ribosyltransferase PARP14-like isoform X2 [Lepisosteus oculatus]|uniref:protein mono-ADP-ribosyltransferase PARP14-like isoform X2 n=1 Tax=Lepisosteus oculatus TaxID=7918 RepID=UPI003712354A
MDEYPFPVLFDLADMEERWKGEILRHFRLRKGSGGGDCSDLQAQGNGRYKIAFQTRRAQAAVLERREHVLQLPGRRITLSVWSPADATTSSSPAAPNANAETDHCQGQHRKPTELPSLFDPASGGGVVEESFSLLQPKKILQVNRYLLLYLQECSQAAKDLQDQLSLIPCSAELRPDAEEVAVTFKGTSQSSRWEAEVEKVFRVVENKYHCHYEASQAKQLALLKTPFLASDNLRVYTERMQGFTVIVGSRKDVEDRLKILDALARKVIRTECRISDAQYSLIEDAFKNEIGSQLPSVVVSREGSLSLVLEGSEDDVRLVRFKLQEMVKQVHECTVQLSRPLVSFLDTRGSAQEYVDFFCKVLKGPVAIEISLDLDLRLLSLDRSVLDVAEKAMLEDLQERTVALDRDWASSDNLTLLKESLQRREAEMNREKNRVQVHYLQDPGMGRIHVQILGFKKEVEKMENEVHIFIEKNSVKHETILLSKPEIVDYFYDLLDLLGMENAQVNILSESSPSPGLHITGPAQPVNELKATLKKTLDSLVCDMLRIDQPGAYEYFQGKGQGTLTEVGTLYSCLIRLVEGEHVKATGHTEAPSVRTGTSSGMKTPGVWSSFLLEGGVTLEVLQGDITDLKMDAIVSGAGESLENAGGVAFAISRAGGPAIQKQCDEWVKKNGKVQVGKAVKTTAGSLPCKAVIHAVGPHWGQGRDSDRVRNLLGKAVRESLELADTSGCQSLAFPCVSSGEHGVPLAICAETIVKEVQHFARVASTLQSVTLVDINWDTVSAFQDACVKLLRENVMTLGTPIDFRNSYPSITKESSVPDVHRRLEIVLGNIEDQQVDVLVAPTINLELRSTKVGKSLAHKAGDQFSHLFARSTRGALVVPGHLLAVDAVQGLPCKRVFFIQCSVWDGLFQGSAVEALCSGLRSALDTCERRGLNTIAFPVIGPGIALGFPREVAISTLLEEIGHFEQTRQTRCVSTIRVVIKPTDQDSAEAFHNAQRGLIPQMANQAAQPSFFHSVTSDLDEVTVTAGGLRVQVVFGDILDETTDVIVNSTDFTSNHTGVCKDILSVAGKEIQTKVETAHVAYGEIYQTTPGNFPCKAIMHVCGQRNTPVIKALADKIVRTCDRSCFQSVAMPAICAGAGGLELTEVAKSILDGISSAVQGGPLRYLTTVRLILLKMNVFQAFKLEVEQRFGKAAREMAVISPPNLQTKHSLKEAEVRTGPGKLIDLGKLFSGAQGSLSPAVLDIVGLKADNVRKVKERLQSDFDNQVSQQEVTEEDLSRLTEEDLQIVLGLVSCHSVQLEKKRDRTVIIRGLRDTVNNIVQRVQKSVMEHLLKTMQDKEQEELYPKVMWCYEKNGHWERFPKAPNFQLENRCQTDVVDGNGAQLSVDLHKMEATNLITAQTMRVKRMENLPDFTFPLHWDGMTNGESLKKVELHPNELEYQKVVADFRKTAGNTVIKVERIQNINLRRGYEAQKRKFLNKNGPTAVGERMMFHGTTASACSSIAENGFNKRYAGQNATRYGAGVYFAVNACYSANPTFSRPEEDGSRYMFAACVLTGRYTLGSAEMKVPPARNPANPNDTYDSLVNSILDPTLFVVFHDDQAYPEYLLTFK